ncbi:MAG: hypothetical protein H8E33_02460 [Candidatus Cloacimonetes bacterium]|nr:hypothetical protein [Candidatus Cloacimonadota bacterium]MBL7107710.1 hypothetical protein [Candidatus Cloacimonadota bacterium]
MSDLKSQISWTSFPLIENPLQSFLLLAFFILVVLFVFEITKNIFWIFISLFFLISSLFSYFIPTTYKFYDKFLQIQYLFFSRDRKHSEFKCFYADKKGVMLSTFSRPRKLDRFRGQSIRFSKKQEEREKVLQFLDEKIGNRF